MKLNSLWVIVVVPLLALQCSKHEPGSRAITSGELRIAVDEAVLPVFLNESSEFQSQYQGSSLKITQHDARDAVVLFASDTVRTIVTGRAMNATEMSALQGGKILYDSVKVAMSAIAVIVHPSNPIARIRLTQLDSIFSGNVTRWAAGKDVIIPYVGGRMSSTNELFRYRILGGRDFGPTVEYVDSSGARVRHVASAKNAIAIVPLNWLQGSEKSVRVLEVGGPDYKPDTTRAEGQYYAPWQAYVWLGYYPLNTPVYLYSRVDEQDVAQGFISFVTHVAGQKIIQNSGLAPATMPVRLVSVTSQQVQ
jgi:phosphate transport system substrate-binding protein